MKKNDLATVNYLVDQLESAENDLRNTYDMIIDKVNKSFYVPQHLMAYIPREEFADFIIPHIKKNIIKIKEDLHKLGIEDA